MGNTEKFDMIAGRYDTAQRIHLAQLSAEAIAAYLEDVAAKTAMDFGCGTGLVGMNLLHRFKSMLFVDTSQSMLQLTNQKLMAGGFSNVATLCFDFEKANHTDMQTDYIFMAQVLLHIGDIQPVLTRLYNVLNPGGHLIIVDFDKNPAVASDMVHNGFDQSALADVLQKTGYRKVQSNTFYTGSQLLMGQDASLFVMDCQRPALT